MIPPSALYLRRINGRDRRAAPHRPETGLLLGAMGMGGAVTSPPFINHQRSSISRPTEPRMLRSKRTFIKRGGGLQFSIVFALPDAPARSATICGPPVFAPRRPTQWVRYPSRSHSMAGGLNSPWHGRSGARKLCIFLCFNGSRPPSAMRLSIDLRDAVSRPPGA